VVALPVSDIVIEVVATGVVIEFEAAENAESPKVLVA
jgi:hypothetical protein